MSDNKKLIKNGGDGTFFGNLLRGVVKTGKKVGIPLLEAITSGNPSGIFKAISGDKSLSGEDKEMLILEMQKDIEYEKGITRRWESDNKQEHWLPRLVRPIVLINYTLLVDVVVLNGIWGKPLETVYMPLLLSLAATVTGGILLLENLAKQRKLKKTNGREYN
jgi:hypothetical protein